MLIRQAEEKLFEKTLEKRRQSSEKSISVLTNGDLRGKNSGGKSPQKRTDRQKLSVRNYDDFE